MSSIIEKLKEGMTPVHCKTEDQAKEFIRICYDNGIEWKPSWINKNRTHWSVNEEDTCYRVDGNKLNYANNTFYKIEGYEIITFEEFMEEYNMKFTKDMLKVGMLVECEEMGLCMIMEDSMLGLVYVSDVGYMRVSDLDDNFENKNDIYSINKVYSIATNYGLGILNKCTRELLWEREDVKELTIEEISKLLGYKVKVVGGNK